MVTNKEVSFICLNDFQIYLSATLMKSGEGTQTTLAKAEILVLQFQLVKSYFLIKRKRNLQQIKEILRLVKRQLLYQNTHLPII